MIGRLVVGLVLISLGFSLVVFALPHAGVVVVLAAGAGGYALYRRKFGA